MKIYVFIFVSSVIINGLLSIRAARLKCPSVEIANGSAKTRSKGRIIAYKCFRGFYLLGEPFAACIKGKWDSSPPFCSRPGCSPIRSLLNGNVYESWRSSLLKFTCNPGYKLLGPSYIYCNGRKWNAMQPYCKAVDIRCDFENKTTCNWEIDDYDDEDFNWRLQQYEPPSRVLKTGPLHDHTLSPNKTGHYIVLETSDYTPSSRPARIHSPVFPKPSDNSSCFIFWYHMYGNTIGVLNVFLNNILVFQRQRNHGDRWIKGIIPLNNESIKSAGDLQLIIEGSYGGGYTGDIGLDDFYIGNGTDCNGAKVTSCVGRCYEDHEDTSFCLCNPECFTDSSCCEDFEDVCRLESTTALIEASTGLEDSTQVYSDSDETTVTEYGTDPPEMPVSTLLEYETVETLAHQYNTDSVTLSSVEDSFLLLGTSQAKKGIEYSIPSIDSYNIEELNTNTKNQRGGKATTEYLIYETTSIPNRFEEKNILNKINDSTTTDENSDTSISFFHKEKEITTLDKHTGVTQSFYPLSVETVPQFNIHAIQKSILLGYKNTSKLILSESTPSIPIKHFFPLSTQSNKMNLKLGMEKIFTKDYSVPNKTITPVPYPKVIFTKAFPLSSFMTTINISIPNHTTRKMSNIYPVRTTVRIVPFKTFSTFVLNKTSTSHKGYTRSILSSTTGPAQTDDKSKNIMFKSVTANKSSTPHIIKINISTAFPILKNISKDTTTNTLLKTSSNSTNFTNLTYLFQTVTPTILKFNNFTRSMPYLINNTLSNVDRNKINDSHTHLRTTSQLPPNVLPVTKYTPLINSLKTSTIQIPQVTVSPKKWKSIYKPKDRFVFSAIQRDKNEGNNTLFVLLICSAVLGIICVLLVLFFIKRRRFNFINEIEEADTDILYHSSQEMLDLHLARPNH